MRKSTKSVVDFPAVRTSQTDLVILMVLAIMGSAEAMEKFLLGVTVIIRKWTWKSDDVTNWALWLVSQKIKEYNPKFSLTTWLYQQCRAAWQTERRGEDGSIPFSMLDTADDEYVSQISSLDKEVQIAEEMEQICSLLDTERQNILSWYFLEGMTFAEIAEKLECSVPTARNRVLSIVNLCRKHFGTKGRVDGLTKNGMSIVH